MTSFILSAAVLVVLALAFVVPTLLRKNQPMSDVYDDFNVAIAKDRLQELKQQRDAGDISDAMYQQLHDELESTLAIDLAQQQASMNNTEAATAAPSKNKIIPVLVGLAVPLLAVLTYQQLGDFNAATGKVVQAVEIPSGENRPQMSLADAVIKLEQKLAENPDNPDGWFMLARTYMATQQYQQSADAYKKLIDLVGEEPQLLLNYADALAMSEGGQLTGKAWPIVEKVKAMAPDNATVLWMSGTAESQQGNFKQALTYWYKLRPMLEGEPQAQGQLAQLIQGAESQLGDALVAELKASIPASIPASALASSSASSATAAMSEDAMPTATDSPASIIVNVDIDPAYKSTVSPADTLFIFAKAMQGPPMPLAAVKLTAGALPITVTLDDSMAMMPQMKLSSFGQVKVSAVISKSGQPGAKAGDLFAEIAPVDVFANETINLLINQKK